MQTPNVTEFPRHLEPVAYDTFLGGSPSRVGQAQPTRNLRSEAKTPPLSRDLNDARCREFERAGVCCTAWAATAEAPRDTGAASASGAAPRHRPAARTAARR